MLVSFLILVQFQNIIGVPIKDRMPEASHIILFIDKIVLIVVFISVLFIRTCTSLYAVSLGNTIAVTRNEFLMFCSLCLFVVWGVVSGLISRNPLAVSVRGIYAYVGYFLTFFIFSGFSWPSGLVQRVYSVMLKVALFLCAVSIFQEVMAFVHPASVLWWPNIQKGETVWRSIFFRAPSLLGHPNSIGIFTLFFLTVELARARENEVRRNWGRICLLSLATLVSVSRSSIIGATVAFMILLKRKGRAVMVVLLALCVGGVVIGARAGMGRILALSEYDLYRLYTLKKSIEVIRDNIAFGVGPGMFGGGVSLSFESAIYRKYHFEQGPYTYLKYVGSIEQQWLMILSELGMVGMAFFVLLFITLVIVLARILRVAADPFLRALALSLLVMVAQMSLFMVGYTVSQVQEWLIPFFMFVGMLSGTSRSHMLRGADI